MPIYDPSGDQLSREYHVFFRGDIVKWRGFPGEYDQCHAEVQAGRYTPRIRDVVFSLEDFNRDIDGTNARLEEVFHAD